MCSVVRRCFTTSVVVFLWPFQSRPVARAGGGVVSASIPRFYGLVLSLAVKTRIAAGDMLCSTLGFLTEEGGRCASAAKRSAMSLR